MVYLSLLLAIPILSLSQENASGSYDFLQNGEDWEDNCKSGNNQSPVNIVLSQTTLMTGESFPIALDFDGMNSQGQFTNVDFRVSGSFGYTRFGTPDGVLVGRATQVRVKAPSEHTIDAYHYDLEVQIIHIIEKTGDYAILSLLYNEDVYENLFLNDLINSESEMIELNLRDAFEGRDTLENYFSYLGSLTTPPCTENAYWFIWASAQSLSRQQLVYFTSNWSRNLEFANGNGNNRAVQNIGDRVILEFFGVDE